MPLKTFEIKLYNNKILPGSLQHILHVYSCNTNIFICALLCQKDGSTSNK